MIHCLKLQKEFADAVISGDKERWVKRNERKKSQKCFPRLSALLRLLKVRKGKANEQNLNLYAVHEYDTDSDGRISFST